MGGITIHYNTFVGRRSILIIQITAVLLFRSHNLTFGTHPWILKLHVLQNVCMITRIQYTLYIVGIYCVKGFYAMKYNY